MVLVDSVVTDAVVTDAVVADAVVADAVVADAVVADAVVAKAVVAEPIDPAFNLNWQHDMIPTDPDTIVIDNFYHIIICDNFNKEKIVKYKQTNVLVYSQEQFYNVISNIKFKVLSVALMISTKDVDIINKFSIEQFLPVATMIRSFNNGGLYIYNCELGKYNSVRDMCVFINDKLQFAGGIMLSTDNSGSTMSVTKESWMLDWMICNYKETYIEKGDDKEINRIDDYFKDVSKIHFHLGSFDFSFNINSINLGGNIDIIYNDLAVVKPFINFIDAITDAFKDFPIETFVCSTITAVVMDMVKRVAGYLRSISCLVIDDSLFHLAVYKYYYINLKNLGSTFDYSSVDPNSEFQKKIWDPIIGIWKNSNLRNDIGYVKQHWSSPSSVDECVYNNKTFNSDINNLYNVLVLYLGNDMNSFGVLMGPVKPLLTTNVQFQADRIKKYINSAMNLQFGYVEFSNVKSSFFLEALAGPAYITKWLIENELLETNLNTTIVLEKGSDVIQYISNIQSTDYYKTRSSIKAISWTTNVGSMMLAAPTAYDAGKKVQSSLVYVGNATLALEFPATELVAAKDAIIAYQSSLVKAARTEVAGKYSRTILECDIIMCHLQNVITNTNKYKVQGKINIMSSSARGPSRLVRTAYAIKRGLLNTGGGILKVYNFAKAGMTSVVSSFAASTAAEASNLAKVSNMAKFGRVCGAAFAILDVTASAMAWAKNDILIQTFKNSFNVLAKEYDDVILLLIQNGDFGKETTLNYMTSAYMSQDIGLARFIHLDDKGCDAEYDMKTGVETKIAIPHAYQPTCKACFDDLLSKLQIQNAIQLAILVVAVITAIATIVVACGSFGLLASAPLCVGQIALYAIMTTTVISISLTVANMTYNNNMYSKMRIAQTSINSVSLSEKNGYNVVIVPKNGIPLIDTSQMINLNKTNNLFELPIREEIIKYYFNKLSKDGSIMSGSQVQEIMPLMTGGFKYDYVELQIFIGTVVSSITKLYSCTAAEYLDIRNALLFTLDDNDMRKYVVVCTNNMYNELYTLVFNANTSISFKERIGTSVSTFLSNNLKFKTSTLFAKNVVFEFEFDSLNNPSYYSECTSKEMVYFDNNPGVWENGFCTGSSDSFKLNTETYNLILNANADTNPNYIGFDSYGRLIIPENKIFKLLTVVCRDSIKRVIDNRVATGVNNLQYDIWKRIFPRWTKVNPPSILMAPADTGGYLAC